MRRRYSQAFRFHDNALKNMSDPARIYYAKGNAFLKQKKWNEAFNAFQKTTLINQHHYPSHLALLSLEFKVPDYQSR